MKIGIINIIFLLLIACSCTPEAPTPSKRPSAGGSGSEGSEVPSDKIEEKEVYNVYLGNTHAHSRFSGDAQQDNNTPEDHFRLAKQSGYDFYAVTDHSQYEQYSDAAWKEIASMADKYTDGKFVGFRGYEHSENDGPDAKGHMNVFNSSNYLNALASGISMKYFHDWVSPQKDVVVCMNHPKENQYNNFHCYNEAVRSNIALVELINGGDCDDYYSSYLIALSKGWKVSPVAGSDLHATKKIPTWPARTGILAKELTRTALVDAMKSRRTYATYDKNLKMVYYANGYVMGSEISADEIVFDISVKTTDADITRVDICTEGGSVVASQKFNSKEVEWTKEVSRGGKKYFFVNVYATDQKTAVAYGAPVWVK